MDKAASRIRLLVNWRTILNKDIDQKTKSNY